MIGSEYQKISDRNAQMSEKKCHVLIEKLHQSIRDKVDTNYYYRIGGYNDYQQDVAAMVREYLKAPGKGVKVHSQCSIEAVLNFFYSSFTVWYIPRKSISLM